MYRLVSWPSQPLGLGLAQPINRSSFQIFRILTVIVKESKVLVKNLRLDGVVGVERGRVFGFVGSGDVAEGRGAVPAEGEAVENSVFGLGWIFCGSFALALRLGRELCGGPLCFKALFA